MLTLYRVGVGETCMQTTLCAAGGGAYSTAGVAETDVTLAMVPLPLFDRLTGESKIFRQFVFSRFGDRMAEMTRVLETIAFVRVDARLARALLARPADKPVSAPIRNWQTKSAPPERSSAASCRFSPGKSWSC